VLILIAVRSKAQCLQISARSQGVSVLLSADIKCFGFVESCVESCEWHVTDENASRRQDSEKSAKTSFQQEMELHRHRYVRKSNYLGVRRISRFFVADNLSFEADKFGDGDGRWQVARWLCTLSKILNTITWPDEVRDRFFAPCFVLGMTII
jgi:hypothetical protein